MNTDKKLFLDKKTIVRLDQAQMGSLNGGQQQQEDSGMFVTVTTIFITGAPTIPATDIPIVTIDF